MSEDVVKKVSAGVIPYREGGEEVEYLLLSHELGHWSFPKGTVGEEEEVTTAALRLLEEETGISAEEVDLETDTERTIEYSYEREGKKHQKTVYLYPGKVDPGVGVEIAPEMNDFEWMTIEEATVQMTYPEPRRLLEEFHKEKYGETSEEPLIDTSLLDEE